MIRVQNFDIDNFIPILSGLLAEDTTSESYIFVNSLIKIMPSDECIQEGYLIMSALEQFYSIFSRSDLVPTISKETLMKTISSNIYEEIKENKNAGFKQYANSVVQVELDLFNDEVIEEVASTLLESIESVLDEAIAKGNTLQQSMAEIINFQTNYKFALLREFGSLVTMISNADMMRVSMHFWGWMAFIRKHRIRGISDITILFNLVSDFVRVKDQWTWSGSEPLTSIDQVLNMKDDYLEDMEPLMDTPFEALNNAIKFTRGEITVLAAAKATGKTTFAAMLAGIALAKSLRVQFYSPEMRKQKLFLENIALAYVRARFGFAVTTPQVLGLEEPFIAGSEHTPEEKKVIIKMALEELASSGNFFHIEDYYMYDTMESDMRAHTKMFNPHLVIIDHSQEIRGEADHNKKTSRLATTIKSIAKDYGPHCFILSHPGGSFEKAIPTPENPISRNIKIVAWSNDLETLADNIMGAIKVGDDEFRIFFTKLRSGVIPPMFQVYRLIKSQCWFDFRPEDQYKTSIDTSEAIEAIFRGENLLIEDDGREDDDEFD